ncbi:MAG: hypothetical protein K0S76_283 [Herbinix sp.]|jgi:hypothetical protein|nr:hypothetical protein [Herbinix sp.]
MFLSKDNSKLKTLIGFIMTTISGPAGLIIGGIGDDLLFKLFGSSVQVITNILTNYTYDSMKKISKENNSTNQDIEKSILMSLAKSVVNSQNHPSIIYYKDKLIKRTRNDDDDLLKFKYFFQYWKEFTYPNNISTELLSSFFSSININSFDINTVNHQVLENNLCTIIFVNLNNSQIYNELKTLLHGIISPLFKQEFLQTIESDNLHKNTLQTIEHDLLIQLDEYLHQMEQTMKDQNSDMKKLIQEGQDIVNTKLDEFEAFSKETNERLSVLENKIDSLHEKLNKTLEEKSSLSTANLGTINQECSPTQCSDEVIDEIDENKVLPIKLIHSHNRKLKGEVFAIELLKKPIRISYDKYKGRYNVFIDRRDVENAIISTTAKTEICRTYVENNRDRLIQLDQEIHQFLLGNTKQEEFIIDLPELGIPLRWASGGVLSVINLWCNDKREQWTPFFFRDINPWGFNIALGASERQFDNRKNCIKPIEYELNYPPSFIYREFMEEMLILESPPKRNSPGRFKRFYFDENRAVEQQREANFFAQEHIKIRNEQDRLFIKAAELADGGFGSDVIQILDVFDTKIDLIVIDKDGKIHKTSNVLVTFNLLELGIEIIKVLEYSIDDGNYILDGEVLCRKNDDYELIRMPCALISHQALKRTFSKSNYTPNYTSEVQPSFIGNNIKKNEFKAFDWDIDQRYSRMTSTGSLISELEKERYRKSYERFSEIFKDKSFQRGIIPTNFVPAAAKALSLYFSRKDSK